MVAVGKKLVTDHLDLWAAAVKCRSTSGRGSPRKVELYGIKKLRELILELAVRGLLVRQDPSDEPAGGLLMKIAVEKARLVKEGVITKEKLLPSVRDEEKPFPDLPSGWEWSRLQSISEYIQRGKSPVYADSGRVRVISQKCVQWAGFDISASRYVDDASLSSYKQERFLKNNDLLWNSTGTGTVGRANVLDEIHDLALVADSHVTVVRTLIVHAKYFCAYISAPGVQRRIEPTHEASLVSGSTQQVELNTSAVVLLPVPVPPLGEQQRIVAKVEELMTLCDKLEQSTGDGLDAHRMLVQTSLNALTNAADHAQLDSAWQRVSEHFDILITTDESIDQLKRTILQLAVEGKLVRQDPNDEPASELLKRIASEKTMLIKEGKIKKEKPHAPISDDEKPFERPKGWEFCRLQEAIDVRDGTHDSPKDAIGAKTFPLVTSKNFINGEIDFDSARRISEGDHFEISRRSRVDVDDILFSMIGGNIGNQVMVRDSRAFSVKNVAIFKYFLKSATIPHFFYLYTQELAAELQYKASGGAQPFVSLGFLRNLVFALPPKVEQQRIVAKVNQLMVLCDQLKSRQNDAQLTQLHLANALTDKALARAR